MYQSVDDIEDSEDGAPKKGIGVVRLKMIALILVIIALLLVLIMVSSLSKQRTPATPDQSAEQYQVYRQAIAEQDPAIRRARLLDFVQTYPRHNRAAAAKAQLSVIEKADENDWASVTEVFYDPNQSKPGKLAALELYEKLWGSNLLGGRQDEIVFLKKSIGALQDTIDPSDDPVEDEKQDFAPPPDKFDDSVSGTEMAGGVIIPRRSYIPPVQTPVTIAPPRRQAIVQPARVIKNKDARYPKRALRKGVTAEVTLALNVDDQGRVQMTELVSIRARKYQKDFIKAAERAALRTEYSPQTINGRPVPATGVLKRYVFRVED